MLRATRQLRDVSRKTSFNRSQTLGSAPGAEYTLLTTAAHILNLPVGIVFADDLESGVTPAARFFGGRPRALFTTGVGVAVAAAAVVAASAVLFAGISVICEVPAGPPGVALPTLWKFINAQVFYQCSLFGVAVGVAECGIAHASIEQSRVG